MSFLFPPDHLKEKGILILEDSRTYRLRIESTLSRVGYHMLFFAENGAEGLKLLKSEPSISFAIVDLEMPVMNGFAFLETMNSEPGYPVVPSIVLTSLENRSFIVKSLNLGASDYISKKCPEEELLARVYAQLRQIDLIEKNDALRLQQKEDNAYLNLAQMKTNFIDTITHELKTPLTNIIGLSSLLKSSLQERLSEEERSHFQHLEDEAESLNNLITQLIEINELRDKTAEELQENREEVDLLTTIETLIPEFEKQIGEKRISFSLQIPEDARIVSVNRNLLTRVLIEAGRNAIKFTRRWGEIGFTSVRKGTKIEVRVSDQGIGVEEEQKEKAFDLFYQVDDSSTRKFGGSGSGLFLCKGLLEKTGERIWFEDNEPKGTILCFTLPAGEKA